MVLRCLHLQGKFILHPDIPLQVEQPQLLIMRMEVKHLVLMQKQGFIIQQLIAQEVDRSP